jgi:hypothetical protein
VNLITIVNYCLLKYKKSEDFNVENDIDVIFFDLFFTLVTPKYNDVRNENDVLGITKEEWKKYAKELGMKTILTGYLLEKERKEHNPVKNFADYYIEDFKKIINIVNN